MESSELYHAKQQFILGAYSSLIDLTLPDPNSPDHNPILLYKARAHIASGSPKWVTELVPADTEDVSLKAVTALARYRQATEDADKDSALEELRDLCVEIEGEDGSTDERQKALVRVIAGTAFVWAGEIEEALETLGAGTSHENLEAVAITVQIYLSINRTDLATKEFNRAKRWAEDDLLLQLIESSIDLVKIGNDAYSNPNSFYNEQLGNPSLTSPHLLTARGVTRLLRGEIPAAKSDFEEALSQKPGDPETFAALTVASSLPGSKRGEGEQFWKYVSPRRIEVFPFVLTCGRLVI
ncbi:hypothetical protein GLOTRDRAFT_39548 [Gloeophyllum trabeum ATCC 11539]|uniref:Coatomer subunit epsilon n=1 Tax=Gloeophyllum trabeum (strain ATCC 11539 / FP-39264 / Madison 617) TaxID=670483 RepID=S7RTP7_GLOTA|nr:uncharacterized protein GLOTRDRAFT_39548 [Gloeophyllum trabeum ATCC 11539]EPQ56504.1 hypothetical protein GLOTRDRAFT_39548 [Gloeophyllum trabeum ATCC 11539]